MRATTMIQSALVTLVAIVCFGREATGAAADPDAAKPTPIDPFTDKEWKLPPGLLNVDLTNFESTVQEHELSVMVFYTKFSPYHRYAQRVLSNVSLMFEARNDVPGVAFCAVDLDDTPELSTYTHFNSIDVMYFYPHLIMNGVRFPGNLTTDAIMNYTYHLYQHSTAHLVKLNEPFSEGQLNAIAAYYAKLATSGGKEEEQSAPGHQYAIRSLEMHLKQQGDILQALVDINASSGALAKESNFHIQRVLRYNGRDSSVHDFLESRQRTELYANFLEHLYARKEVPQTAQTITPMHAEAAAKKKKEEEEAAQEPEEVLF